MGLIFSYYDVEADLEMQIFIKIYSKWPTFPQVYIEGELIGGLDVFRGLISSGKLSIPEKYI